MRIQGGAHRVHRADSDVRWTWAGPWGARQARAAPSGILLHRLGALPLRSGSRRPPLALDASQPDALLLLLLLLLLLGRRRRRRAALLGLQGRGARGVTRRSFAAPLPRTSLQQIIPSDQTSPTSPPLTAKNSSASSLRTVSTRLTRLEWLTP